MNERNIKENYNVPNWGWTDNPCALSYIFEYMGGVCLVYIITDSYEDFVLRDPRTLLEEN